MSCAMRPRNSWRGQRCGGDEATGSQARHRQPARSGETGGRSGDGVSTGAKRRWTLAGQDWFANNYSRRVGQRSAWRHFRRWIACRIRSWFGHRLRGFVGRIAGRIMQRIVRRIMFVGCWLVVQGPWGGIPDIRGHRNIPLISVAGSCRPELVPRRSDYDSLSWASRVAAAGSG
jgi:murein DD-endopeptidase MepM/ murein hydrolase activator NlpD